MWYDVVENYRSNIVYPDIKKIILDSSKEIESIYSRLINEDFFILPITNKVPGHYCSNFLFTCKISSEEKASFIVNLQKHPLIDKAEIINGYVNLTLEPSYFLDRVRAILSTNILPDIGKSGKVNVEYCSVNPTGYLHIGHARNAILGDALARILEKVNYCVTKEYYVNDGGNQINLMAESVHARFCKLNNIDCTFPEDGYKGEEMREVAKTLPKDVSTEGIKKIAVEFFLNHIKKDLEKINISYDSWVFESQIIKDKYIEKALAIFKEKGYISFEKRYDKRVSKGNVSNNNLMLLKSTLLGDDQDRPLIKADGSWTYFAPDIGYHLNKIERGFKFLVCVLGADHDSYAKRIKIATTLLDDSVVHKTPICQMVSFENKGTLVKFSKRMGNSIRIADFVQEISPDILRFMILEKSADTQFVFNYDNAVNITMKNPLFYCQYAFARASSILRKDNSTSQETNQYSPFFENEDVQDFIITLDMFQQILKEAANELAPHKLVNYTKKLCEKMHKLWQIGKINAANRILLDNNQTESNTRKLLIHAFIKTAKECFYCLGINAPEKME